jgi:hypothetical protein
MSFCCECCGLSGRDLCVGLITRPEESYRLSCVVVCDLETSWMRRPWPTEGCRAKNKQTILLTCETLSSYKKLKLQKISPSGFHACRNRRLKWIQVVRGHSWTTLSPVTYIRRPDPAVCYLGVRLTPSPCNSPFSRNTKSCKTRRWGGQGCSTSTLMINLQ